MTKEKIHESLDKMLETPKSKSFLNHLLRAYFPITNVRKVMEKPTKKMRCVLSNAPLFSLDEILMGMESEEFKKDLMESLKNIFKEDGEKINPFGSIVGDKKMGFTGKGTTTFISYEAYQELYNWMATKIVSGDKHINWLMGQINHIKKSNVGDDKRKENKQSKFITSTFSIGDASDSLLKLKKELENNEK
jgi:hypothetical protein